MFPDLRLLIGALAATIAALCCGFGMFAAFRVNHEPLSRLPAATAPLQLVINEPAAPRQRWGAPAGGLVPLNVSDVPMTRTAVSSARPAAIEAAKSSTAAAVVDAPRQHASLPATQTVSANPAAAAAQSPPAEAKHAGAAQSSTAASSDATAATAPLPVASSTSAPAAETLPAKSPATAPSAAANESASDAPSHSAEAPAVAVAVIDPVPAQAAADAHAAADSVPIPEARPVRPTKLHKAIAKALERRRIAARRRLVRKPLAPVVAQFGGDSSTFHDPVFQSAPESQKSPAARARSTTKTTANSGATTNSFAWPNAQ